MKNIYLSSHHFLSHNFIYPFFIRLFLSCQFVQGEQVDARQTRNLFILYIQHYSSIGRKLIVQGRVVKQIKTFYDSC